MGNIQEVEVGSKSSRKHEPATDEEVDFKNPMNAARARRELYSLFLQDKIVHSSVAQELHDKIERLQTENTALKKQLEEYKQWNQTQTIRQERTTQATPTPEPEPTPTPEPEPKSHAESSEDSDDEPDVKSFAKTRDKAAGSSKSTIHRSLSAPKLSGTREQKDLQSRISRIAEKIKAAQQMLRTRSASSEPHSKKTGSTRD